MISRFSDRDEIIGLMVDALESVGAHPEGLDAILNCKELLIIDLRRPLRDENGRRAVACELLPG